MAVIDFPNSPSVNDTFTANNRTWTYVGNGIWDTVETSTIAGPTGPQGDQGPANVLSIGVVSSTIYDGTASVSITGNSPEQELSFILREGPTGPETSLTIGTVDTSLPGATGSVTISGPPGDQVLSFTLPMGPTGPATSISVTSETGLPGGSATVSVSGPAGSQTVAFTIPQGPTGPEGNWTVAETTPTAPAVGDGNGWFDSTNGRFYVWYDSYWVEVTSNKIGPTGPTGPNGDPTLSVTGPTLTSNNYTIAIGDQSKLIRIANGTTSSIVYVPTDATHNFPIGTQINILREGTGQLTVAASTPGTTTINAAAIARLRSQWSGATLVKTAANTWWLSGDLG